jgi:two-component system chemotaxis response regulator CheY
MKILLLQPDPKENAVIRQSLAKGGHQIVQIETSEQVWPWLEKGEPLFLLGDWDSSDLRNMQFIPRANAAKHSAPLYILLLTSKRPGEETTTTGADDILYKPYTPQELKKRVSIGERIITLAGNLAQAHDQLESTAMFDSLTNVMNRSAFYRQATGELERARRASAPISLIALDIDNFKTINNTYGNPAGDEVQRIVSQTIRERSRPYDCIGRWTGGEFLIMLPGVIGTDAEKIAERIIGGVRATKIEVRKDAPISIQISAGIASASRISASTEVELLIAQARQAMSRAKEAGGGQIFLAYV